MHLYNVAQLTISKASTKIAEGKRRGRDGRRNTEPTDENKKDPTRSHRCVKNVTVLHAQMLANYSASFSTICFGPGAKEDIQWVKCHGTFGILQVMQSQGKNLHNSRTPKHSVQARLLNSKLSQRCNDLPTMQVVATRCSQLVTLHGKNPILPSGNALRANVSSSLLFRSIIFSLFLSPSSAYQDMERNPHPLNIN